MTSCLKKKLSLWSSSPLLLSNPVISCYCVMLTWRLSVYPCVVLTSLNHHLFFSRHASLRSPHYYPPSWPGAFWKTSWNQLFRWVCSMDEGNYSHTEPNTTPKHTRLVHAHTAQARDSLGHRLHATSAWKQKCLNTAFFTWTLTQLLRLLILSFFIDLWLWLLQITKDGCGKTKSCYSEPESCTTSSDCRYLVTMKPVGGEDSDSGEVEFELSTVGQWGSIGFNNEKNEMVRQWTGPILVMWEKLVYLLCGSLVRRLLHWV